MLPQAEADRQRARQLAEAGGYEEEEVFATSGLLSRPSPPARISRRVGREARPEGRPRLRGIPEPVVLAVALAGMAATGFGLFMAADAIGGADINLKVFDFETFQSSEPEATAGPTAPPTAEPTPPPVTPPPEALAGNPFSFSNLDSAWKSKGITVSVGALSAGFTNIRAQPFDVTLTKGTERATLSVIIYANRNTPQDDWNLPPAAALPPKRARPSPPTIPSGGTPTSSSSRAPPRAPSARTRLTPSSPWAASVGQTDVSFRAAKSLRATVSEESSAP